jgi:uncharacterized protein (DUF2236 family)
MPKQPRKTLDLITSLGSTMAAANVIMQLASPGVGHGVLESPVDRSSAFEHPIKRARTTGQYLAVAVGGTDDDVTYTREQLRHIHSQVASAPNAVVSYSANSPDLQLWVAACLYRYFLDQYEFLHGPLDDAAADAIYADAARLGTTLNVRPEMWPVDRAAFEVYWRRQLHTIRIAPAVRDMLVSLADLSFLEGPLGLVGTALHKALGRPQLFMTKGALPEPFREAMGWSWTAKDTRRYRRVLGFYRQADRILAGPLKGANELLLADMRIRRRFGIAVF